MGSKEKLVDLFINTVGFSEVDANIYADDFIENGIIINQIKHGKWECVNESENVWMCTGENGCGNEIILLEGNPNENELYYCPHCGAKMDA